MKNNKMSHIHKRLICLFLCALLTVPAFYILFNNKTEIQTAVEEFHDALYRQVSLAGQVVQVVACWESTILLKEDGTVWVFGNDLSKTGPNQIVWDAEHPQITRVPMLNDIVELSSGAFHVLARKNDGTLFAWGANDRGQLGDGTYQDSSIPVQVLGLSNVTSIAASAFSNIAISDGVAMTWGDGANEPYVLPGLQNFEATAITGGAEHFLATNNSNMVYGLGENRFGETGIGTISESYGEGPAPSLTGVRDLAAGYRFSLAVLEDYTAWSWGLDGPHLGLGTSSISINPISVPQQIPIPIEVNAVTAGEAHALAIDNDRKLWAWGRNDRGQLGVGDDVDRAFPDQVLLLEDIVQIASGRSHSAALDDNGQIWLWGDNSFGQLGLSTSECEFADTPFILFEVDDTFLTDVKTISVGYDHTLAVKNDGSVLSWGDNSHGQLGFPAWDLDEDIYPRVINGLSNITKLASGDGFSIALDASGHLYTWGRNDFGQLGRGPGSDDHVPTMLALTGVIDIAAGQHHVLALTNVGTVYSWGRAFDNQLGIASPGDKATPQQVITLSNIKSIAAGSLHSLALRTDGSIYAWGSNVFGQLGLGNSATAMLPQQIQGVSGIAAIVAGGYHSLALTTSGEILSWGLNEYGQLGLGDYQSARTPRTVVTANGEPLCDIIKIAAGEYDSIAISENGTCLAWGMNAHHQLGDRTTLHSPFPVEPIRLWYPLFQIDSGGRHVVALTESGKVWSWGGNYDAQTGRPSWVEWDQAWEHRWDDMDKPMRTMREQ